VQARHGAILVGIAGAAFLGPFTQTVYTPNLPELQRYFDVNTVLINLTISLFTAILAVSNFVVGPLADVRGRRAVLLPGLLLFAAGSLLCMVATSYGVFLAGRAVQACGITTALVVAPAVVGDLYAPDRRARAMSAYQMVTFLGPVLGPVVGGYIAAHLSWRWAFGLLAAGALLAWIYNYRRLPETMPQSAVPQRITARRFTTVLADRSALAIVLIAFSQFYGYYEFLVFLPSLLDSLFAVAAETKGLFFVPLTAGMFAGIAVGARWQRYWTRTRILITCSYGLAGIVLTLWLGLTSGLIGMSTLIAVLLAYGMLLGCSLPVQSTILVSLFARDKGTAMGIYNFLRFTGAALGPMLGGMIAIAWNVNAVFLNVAVLLGLAALLIHRYLEDPTEASRS